MKKKSRTTNGKRIINKLLIGGEPKKVLVLCQRKTGLSESVTPYKVEDEIIPKINLLISILLGNDDISIIYMSSIDPSKGTVDINCLLNGETECSRTFISENKNSFDLIILQTCPFFLMKYSILHSLLKPNGMLGVTSLPKKIMGEDQIFQSIKCALTHIPIELFEIEGNDDFFITQNITLYRKIERDGGMNKKKSKRNK
jgi:hypothetical protein